MFNIDGKKYEGNFINDTISRFDTLTFLNGTVIQKGFKGNLFRFENSFILKNIKFNFIKIIKLFNSNLKISIQKNIYHLIQIKRENYL